MASQPEPVFPDVAPWPASNPRAVPGDNRPPLDEEAKAQFREALLSDVPAFEQRVDDLEAASHRAKVESDEQYGRAGEFIKQLRAARKHVEGAHVVAKEPYLKAGRAVDAEKNALVGRLDQAAGRVQPQMNAYAAKREAEERAQRERIAAEQRRLAEEAAAAHRVRERAEQEAIAAAAAATSKAERRKAEERRVAATEAAEEAQAAASLAPAAPMKSEPVRSDGGATVSTRQVWNSEVQDYGKAFKSVKGDAKVREAIDTAIKRRVAAGDREIAGVKIWPTVVARTAG